MAKDNKSGTIYQQLNQFFNLDGFGYKPMEKEPENQKVQLRGNSPEEIKQKALELEQKRKLQDKFFRTTDRGFQKALQYEAARLPAYIDYEGMEYYPLIASALDLFMEEATSIGTDGKMLNIYSNKERIKSLLETFFYDIVNVNVNLPFWSRNLPIKHDSIIPLLDGTEMTIKEISEKMKNNPDEEVWTYSIQNDTKSVVAGKIVWCDLTRKNSEIVKINLDDGSFIETTPDHEILLRNGSYTQAQNLKPHMSLMPFYTRESIKNKDSIGGYEKVYNPSSDHYKYTHRVVAHELHRDKEYEQKIGEMFDTHHVDFNKKNNHPLNLQRLTRKEHFKIHQDLAKEVLHSPEITEKRMKAIDTYLRSEKRRNYLSEMMSGIYPDYFKEYNNSELHGEHNIIRSESMKKHWSDPDYKDRTKKLMQINFSDKSIEILNKYICSKTTYISKREICNLLLNDKVFVKDFKKHNNKIKRKVIKALNKTRLDNMLLRKTGLSYLDYVVTINPQVVDDKEYIKVKKISSTRKSKKEVLNHKVVSVEYQSEKSDVYCMEVVGKNGEHDRHNFPVCSKDNEGNYNRNGVFVSNCKYGDNFVLLYGEKSKGLTHVKQMVNYEIERFERVHKGKPMVKFKERMTGDEFNIFEVAHFRLLGDDKFLPYGSSILNKVRRVFRQCLDSETNINTPQGSVKIKDIKTGDNVYSYDIDSEKPFVTVVKNVSNNGIRERYEITTNNDNKLIVTDDHPILINNGDVYSYKNINEINSNEDDIVLPSLNNDDISFEKITNIEKLDSGEVWDIEVDNDFHNFIAEGVVVHNCVMAEDAMLTYRIVRAGEKKVFKIDVGNIDEEDIEDYIYKVATKFKKTMDVQPNDGQIDYRFNILGNDEDYFIPVRNANTETGIDTLPGADNLDKIHDIEYLRDNLFMGLGVPKPFLSFQDAAGGGKNLAQYDIRFAKKVNRIQQALIQELNKMAMIHLHLLGYSKEDLSNFKLTLTNPSTQQELLKSELYREKSQVYTELTRGENGVAAMSHTRAKKLMFNMSDREIVEDLKQQKMEKVVQQELADAPVHIKQSGIYKDIDKKYGEEEPIPADQQGEEGMSPEEGGGGEEGSTPEPIEGLPNQTPADLPPVEAEGVKGRKPINEMSEEEYNQYIENMVYGNDNDYKKENKRKEVISENEKLNETLNQKATDMINEIDSITKETDSINSKFKDENEEINLDEIENLELGDDEDKQDE